VSSARNREFLVTFALIGLCGGLVLLLSAPAWVSASVSEPGLPVVSATLNGKSVVPLAPATGLLALAGAIACLLAGRWWRTIVGIALVILAGFSAAALVDFLRAPKNAIETPLSDLVGLTQVSPQAISVSLWPRVVFVLCVVIALAGLWLIARASNWQSSGRRFEQPTAQQKEKEAVGDPSAASSGTRESQVQSLDAVDLWDAIDQGTDPTAAG